MALPTDVKDFFLEHHLEDLIQLYESILDPRCDDLDTVKRRNTYDRFSSQPRYLRWLQPSSLSGDALENIITQISKEVGCKVTAIMGKNCFGYAIPALIRIEDGLSRLSFIDAYVKGLAIGMEWSSAMAVLALNIQPDDRVLDLCCAPGAKLCMAAGIISEHLNSLGSVTGVDISQSRLSITKSLVQKASLHNVRLYCADGTIFSESAPTTMNPLQLKSLLLSGERRSHSSKELFYAPRLLRHAPVDLTLKYDKILVDSECTHDGSLQHVVKCAQNNSWSRFISQFVPRTSFEALLDVQFSLLENGFRLLRPGGTLIYSTCSMIRAENEDIVIKFLEREPCAALVPIEFDVDLQESVAGRGVYYENAKHDYWSSLCVRFTPSRTGDKKSIFTGGLFLAKLQRRICKD